MSGLLLVEYLAASLGFDVQPLKAKASWIGWTGDAAGLLLVALTAVVVLARAPDRASLAKLKARILPLPSVWRWGVAHALAAIAFFGLTASVSGRGLASAWGAAWLPPAWGLAVLVLVVTGLGLAVPARAGVAMTRLVARPALVGLLAGVAAWSLARATEGLWPSLSRVTLEGAAAVLRTVAPAGLFKDPARLHLGLDDFVVEVSAGCSGIQGMGLIGMLTTAYVVRFRHTLKLPRAALIIPLGIAGAFVFNIFRIAALVWVGARISEDAAMGGFHSKSGWLLSCLIALGILAWVRRSPDLSRDVEANAEPATEAEPSNPTVAYLAPLMVNLALVLVTGAAVASFDLLYPARVWLVAVALAWIGRRHLGMASRAWRPAPAAVVLGVLVVPLWLLLAKSTADGSTALGEALGALSPAARAVWIGARILGMAILAPVTEELAFRGFLLRRLHDADFDQVDYAAAARRPVPLLVSSLAFGAVHGSFLAGTIAGVIYGVALLPRGRLSDAVAAHVVTNAILLLCAAVTSSWAFA